MSMDYRVVVGYGFLIPNDLDFFVTAADATGYKQYTDYFDAGHFLAETLQPFELLEYNFVGNYAQGSNEGVLISAQETTVVAEANSLEELPPLVLSAADDVSFEARTQLRSVGYELYGKYDVPLGWIVGSYIG